MKELEELEQKQYQVKIYCKFLEPLVVQTSFAQDELMNEREKLEQKALDEDDLITINLLFPLR